MALAQYEKARTIDANLDVTDNAAANHAFPLISACNYMFNQRFFLEIDFESQKSNSKKNLHPQGLEIHFPRPPSYDFLGNIGQAKLRK